MGVNAYFCPRITNRSHAIPNYGQGKSNFEKNIIARHILPGKLACKRGNLVK